MYACFQILGRKEEQDTALRVEVPLLAGVRGAAEGSRREVFEAASRGSGVGGSW